MKKGGGGGGGQCIYFRSLTYIIEFLMNIWWQLILIRSHIIIWSYLCDQNWWIIIKKNRYEFSSVFIDQRLPNMVQGLFADVIHDAIWLMNIHEQKYPWFLAMFSSVTAWPNESKFGRKHPWKALYKVCWLISDPLTNMAATGNSCFWLVDF